MKTLAPRDENETVDVVRAALANATPVDVVGSGSRCGLGRPTRAGVQLSTSGLVGVTLYEPSELVLRAKAGTPIQTITALLDEQNQELAFEPIDHAALYGGPNQAGTIGGLIGVNASGPRRIKVGGARDHLLGFRAINGRAEIFQSGGRVMKNVTGYDMCKVMAGSFGTLGVLSEITIKVMPKAEMQATVIISDLNEQTAVRVMTFASGLPHEVSGLAHVPRLGAEFAPPSSKSGSQDVESSELADRPQTALRVEGPEVSVRQRINDLKSDLAALIDGTRARFDVLEGPASVKFWKALRDVAYFAETSHQVWRISTAPSEGAKLIEALRARGAPIAGYFYDWAGGLIWLAVEPAPNAHAIPVRETIAAYGGHATLVRADDSVRNLVEVFQPQPDALAGLSARLRRGFDPELILNRGRMRGDL